MLISPNVLDVELSKLKDRWTGEFSDLLDFSKDGMHTWTVDYTNLNNNVSICIV